MRTIVLFCGLKSQLVAQWTLVLIARLPTKPARLTGGNVA